MTQIHQGSLEPTLLLVDDHEATLEETGDHLERLGFRVIKQTSPFGVTNLVRRHKPDAIVLDIMMPGLNGEGLSTLIRKDASVPIVFFSAMQEEYLRDLVMKIGDASYVLKSEGIQFLADEIRKMVRRNSRGA